MNEFNLQWPFAWGAPLVRGNLKTLPEDFRVEEMLPFTLTGEGEHLYLQITKTQLNTQDLLLQVSRTLQLPMKLISHAGLKDKQAVTTQWISLHLPGKIDPDYQSLASEQVQVNAAMRHNRKLQTGALSGNRFQIRVRDLQGDVSQWAERCQQVQRGVPNYFGLQRFGHEGKNLQLAQKLFRGEINVKDRHRRGLYLSAARSWLFNQLLAQRVAEGSWNKPLPGDCMQLSGRRSFFLAENIDAVLEERCEQLDVHPTGPLWGSGALPSRFGVAAQEANIANDLQAFSLGLEQAGLEQERRALRLIPEHFEWQMESEHQALFTFVLGPGSYATEVMRELVLPTGDC